MSLLEKFLPVVPEYAAKRNLDVPGEQFVSGLSPYIRYRLVREREIVDTVLDKYSYSESAKFLEEIAWRSYWKGYLEMRPTIWTDYSRAVRTLPDQMSDLELKKWQAARQGQSGVECFDHWVRQLKETGWLHNHARMWFASIWIFTLRLPWELGAAFFMEHLLDGDPASNTLSWRWVGGLHTRGKHYIARASNIAKCTKNHFYPVDQLDENPEPLSGEKSHTLLPFSPVEILSEDVLPSLSQSPAGLLVCPEDLSPESGPLQDSPFASYCVFNGRDIMDATNYVT